VRAPGEARSDADIVCALAREMGHVRGFDFGSAEAIWYEIRAVWNKRLTGPACDPITHTPEYKVTAVRIIRL